MRLNNEYQLVSILGDGYASDVWLAHSLFDPSQRFAIKLIKDDFLALQESNQDLKNEVRILQ